MAEQQVDPLRRAPGPDGLLSGIKLRPIGGAQNDLVNPALDATPGSSEIRLGPQNFAPGTTDGITPGPNARTVSNVISSGPQAETTDPTRSAWLYVFGQFVDHDLDLLTPDPSRPLSIPVPAGDPDLPDGTVIPTGGRANLDANGNIINAVAGYLDLSQIYGSDAATAASLRNADGTLKTSAGNALPVVNGHFVAGDVRVEENPELVAVTTLFVREHNFQVARLAKAHPDWSGDQLYQAARAVTTAEYQNIVYSEFLPSLLGPGAVPAYHGYNPNVSAQVAMEFTTAAFRVGHSQISGQQQGIDNNGNVVFQESLAQAFGNTPVQDKANGIDALIRNLSNDFSQQTDVYAVPELRNQLAAPPNFIDLIAIDVERERDVGLGTLNQTREALGLAPYTSFSQITSDPTVQANLQQVYDTVDNVDLFIGGLAEDHLPGSTVGPTFQAIIARQFDNLQTGDRFFWQNQGFDARTSQMIASTTLSDIISRDAGTPDMQANAFIAAERHLSNVPAADPSAAQLVIGIDADNTVIAGGPADDTIFAGEGLHQTLTGAGGADVFVFANSGPVDDTISDFDPASDKLDLRGLIKPSDIVEVAAEASGSVLKIADSQTHLANVAPSSLTTADFFQSVELHIIGGAVS